MRKTAWMMACAVGALGFGAGAAQADTATTTATDTSGATTVTDIMVTATKRELTIQHVATAVSAYSSKERDLVGLNTISDLQNIVPGLRYSAGLDRVFLRGVGRQTNNLATDPGVATYVDGVYDAATYDAGGDSLFIARQEVLRGPQGTLYGRNSIGGDINVISVMPTDHYYAEARASVGNYGASEIEGVTSGPITDALRFRVGAAYTAQNQGYFTNVANPKQTEDGNGTNAYFEGQLQYQTSRLDLWGKAYLSQYGGTYRTTNVVSPYDDQEYAPAGLGPNLGYAYNPGFIAEGGTHTQLGSVMSNPAINNQWDYNTNYPNAIRINPNYGFTWHATYHADGFDIRYLGGWAHHNLQIFANAAGDSPVNSLNIPLATTPSPLLLGFGSLCALDNAFGTACGPLTVNGPANYVYTENKTWMSHELDFVSTGDSPLQWIGGAYYYHEQYNQSIDITLPNQPQVSNTLVFGTGPAAPFAGSAATTPVLAAPNPTRILYDSGQNMQGDSYAGFGEIDWKFTPQWKLTVGLRYNYDDKHGNEFLRLVTFGASYATPEQLGTLTPAWDETSFLLQGAEPGASAVTIGADGFGRRNLDGQWSGVTGTAGLEWDPTSDLLAYLKYSRGYKSGGFNAGATLATDPEVGPESLDDFEGGVKKTFADYHLTVDLAAFYYNYDNMQIELGELTPGGTTSFFLEGLPQVRNWGVELESTWQATDNLQFILSYAYLNTDIVKSSCYEDPIANGLSTPSLPSCVNHATAATTAATQYGFVSVKGDQLIDSPPNKISLNANYTFHFSQGSLTFSATDTWTDYHYSAIFNSSDYYSPGYNNLDLRMLWNDAKDRYTIIVYGRNVLNAVQYDYIYPGTSVSALQGVAGLGPQVTHSLNAPVTYGVQLQVRFR
jgi:iron complex outermembrane receptor protein